jgi:N,N'-diacetyllegionaminate synthase
MMNTVKIGGRKVGDQHPCFISFEAGATHGGLESAMSLCKAAKDAGADAVKFQTVRARDLMVSDDTEIEFETAAGVKKKESVFKALERRELTFNQWKDLKKYCDDIGILFVSTPSGEETINWLVELNAAAIKVSKSDINHRNLIRYMAQTGLPIILDGRERFEDVEAAVQICEKQNMTDIVIMHCPSGYPASHAGIHLNAIPHIREIFKYPVGYSDHSVGTAMNFAAIALGADFIEKTITDDRATEAVEHFMSLEKSELKPFVEDVRAVEAGLGDPRIIFSSRVKSSLRRSIRAKVALKEGDILSVEHLDFKRPGNHLPVDQLDKVVGQPVTRDIPAGDFLEVSDVGGNFTA